MNYYKRHIGDYAAATRHLSMIEHGAYTLLLDVYYTGEKPLPAEERAVHRLVGARSKEEREAVTQVLGEFFTLREDGWHQGRCDEEIGKKQAQAEINRVVGKRGGRPKKQTESDIPENRIGSEPETETVSEKNPSHKPLANSHKPEEQTTPQPPRKRGASSVPTLSVDDLERQGVPTDVSTAFLALRARKRAPLTELALAGILREADKAGWTLDRALRKCVERGWQGFEAEWVRGAAAAPGSVQQQRAAWGADMDAVIARATGAPQTEIDMGVIDATGQPV